MHPVGVESGVFAIELAELLNKSNDTRSAAEIAAMLRAQHLDPVWKDWDEALLAGGVSAVKPAISRLASAGLVMRR